MSTSTPVNHTTTCTSTCPFCFKAFKRVGNHLQYCKSRNGADYSCYLSTKTIRKRASSSQPRQRCPKCSRLFKRLETHLRTSATCKALSSSISTLPTAVGSHNKAVDTAGRAPSPVPLHESECKEVTRLHIATTCTGVTYHRERLRLPKTTEGWAKVNSLLHTVVSDVVKEKDLNMKNKALCDGVYSVFATNCGTKPIHSHQSTQYKPHNRSLKKLKKHKISAKRALRAARRECKSSEEVRELNQLYRRAVRKYYKAIKKSHKMARNADVQQVRKECANSFWRFARKVLDEDYNTRINPSFDCSTAEEYFQQTYSSQQRSFRTPDWLPPPDDPTIPFNTEGISLDELFQAMKKVCCSSAPSPFDQISYSIICNCPALVPALLDLYNECWKKSEVPSLWRVASIQLIPKKSAQEDSSNPANFRPIALTPCISKLFSTIMKNRLISFMISNKYFDKTIQKAFMPSVPGCVEHYVKLATAVHEAHSHHKSIAVCWLDLSNAYGSVHHNLISFSLSHYKAPEQFISLVNNLYSDLSASINTKLWSTPGIPLNKGVFQGDPLSVVIFNCVMNTYIDAIKPCLSSSYNFSNSSQSLGLLQYADDTCLVTDGPSSCQNLLNLTDLWLTWSGMTANISKCQCLAVRASSGKV